MAAGFNVYICWCCLQICTCCRWRVFMGKSTQQPILITTASMIYYMQQQASHCRNSSNIFAFVESLPRPTQFWYEFGVKGVGYISTVVWGFQGSAMPQVGWVTFAINGTRGRLHCLCRHRLIDYSTFRICGLMCYDVEVWYIFIYACMYIYIHAQASNGCEVLYIYYKYIYIYVFIYIYVHIYLVKLNILETSVNPFMISAMYDVIASVIEILANARRTLRK